MKPNFPDNTDVDPDSEVLINVWRGFDLYSDGKFLRCYFMPRAGCYDYDAFALTSGHWLYRETNLRSSPFFPEIDAFVRSYASLIQ